MQEFSAYQVIGKDGEAGQASRSDSQTLPKSSRFCFCLVRKVGNQETASETVASWKVH